MSSKCDRYSTIRSNQKSDRQPAQMPVNKSLYPDNWKAIALKVKEAAQWQCGCCGKKCYKPGERPEGLSRSEWTADIC